MPRRKTDAEPLSTMTSEEFCGALRNLFGKRRWKAIFSEGSGYSRTQIYRYSTGHPIPQRVATFIECLGIIRCHGLALPVSFQGFKYIPLSDVASQLDEHEIEHRSVEDVNDTGPVEPVGRARTAPSNVIVVIKPADMSDSDVLARISEELVARGKKSD